MREYLIKIIEPVLKGETTSFERYIIHNGENHWYYVKFSPVFNKNQQVDGFIMSMENITDRKKNDIALNKSLELVTEQNKRLLNFSYIVSHNLRSHASNMISILNFLEKEKSEQEKASLMVHLKKVSQLLNETLFNLNEVVSIQKNLNTTIESLNLFTYINQTIAILNKEISSKNAIVENQVPSSININFNPAYLESILLNFLTNAIKYSSPDRQPLIQFKIHVNQSSVELMISDNGIGIDLKKYHDRIFGMYKTFHGNKDARGIGLFISKNQIDAMGGKVEIFSEPNRGTTFKITFI
jgi:signal transduction histidine kinase